MSQCQGQGNCVFFIPFDGRTAHIREGVMTNANMQGGQVRLSSQSLFSEADLKQCANCPGNCGGVWYVLR